MRTGGGDPAAGPIPGFHFGAVFKEFKPISEWQQDDESHTLAIHLPGFFKEQIRVSIESQNMIRVRGERLVGGNKWSRFLEDFQVPENCEMNSVRAKFQGGVLNIQVPKKIVDKKPQFQESLIPPKISSTTTNTSANTQKQPTHQKEEILPPLVGTSKPTDDKKSEPQKVADDPSPKQVHQDEVRHVAERNEKSDELKEKHIASERTYDHVLKEYIRNELNEERQILLNMCAGILVILVLSAYVTYSFTWGKN